MPLWGISYNYIKEIKGRHVGDLLSHLDMVIREHVCMTYFGVEAVNYMLNRDEVLLGLIRPLLQTYFINSSPPSAACMRQ